jgi:spoIIIJ-associated protein
MSEDLEPNVTRVADGEPTRTGTESSGPDAGSGETSEAARRVRDLLEEIADSYDLDAEVEVKENDETIRGELVGEDLGLVIGRHGQTIDAMEHLALRLAYRGSDRGDRKRIVIDAAGYRGRREDILQREADKAASDAVRLDRAVALDAMGAQERKLVHEYLRDRHDVETHSEGDEPDRHLVVSPVVSSD